MKAALMTEASLIPGVALLDKLNPESKSPCNLVMGRQLRHFTVVLGSR